eukprot:11224360-Lingulodinium_polyedra.AAC.1
MAYSRRPLAGDGMEPVRWTRAPHAIVAGSAIECRRCRGCVPVARRAAFEGRRCPAWWCNSDTGPPGRGPDWGAWAYG